MDDFSEKTERNFSENKLGGKMSVLKIKNVSYAMTDGGRMDIFAMSYGLLILIIVLAVIAASWMILVKKPKEILAKIS